MEMQMYKIKTVFCDIDGTLIRHHGSLSAQVNKKPEILKGVIKRLDEWDRKCYNIILTTGRKESLRKITEEQLHSLGIAYDQLVMGISGGPRVLINDLKPHQPEMITAVAINLNRNEGLEDVEI
tara:strand:+ start:1283 stop:1654 length:372 start_codon:yes stop_codon:yes gene_type:complete